MRKILFILISLVLIATSAAMPAYAYLIKGLEREIETVDVKIGGKTYVLLADVCEANGIEWEWDTISRRISLRKNGREAILLVGSRLYLVGEEIEELSAPLEISNGNIYIPLRFSKYTVKRLFGEDKKTTYAPAPAKISKKKAAKAAVPRPSKERYRIKKVVIDPGHGGKDPGAIGRTGLREKDVVLEVSRLIREELKKNGIDAVMTRNSDDFIPLSERASIANRNDADLFISIHANANKAKWLSGFEVYYLSEATDDNARALATAENSVLKYEENSFAKHTKSLDAIVWDLKFTENREESIELAGFICQEAGKRLKLNNNKVRSARFYVLKGTEMPAVLVELSYLSNRWDEKNLKSSYYKTKLAQSIVAGIMGYKDEYERTNGFSQ